MLKMSQIYEKIKNFSNFLQKNGTLGAVYIARGHKEIFMSLSSVRATEYSKACYPYATGTVIFVRKIFTCLQKMGTVIRLS